MEFLSWLLWAILSALSIVWSLVWFLISGWVSTLVQIAILVGAIFYFKYGWRRAPAEIWRRTRSLGRFVWGWIRQREPGAESRTEVREVLRVVRRKEFGDISISTLMTLLMIGGLLLLPAI